VRDGATGPRWPHTAAILAGGRSLRMGMPKELVRLPDGRMMIDAVASVLASIADRVVVLGVTPARPDLRHLPDLHGGLGPLGGIEALLASGIDERYLVCPCDVPRITAPVLRALIGAAGDAMAVVLHLRGEEAPRPLPLVVSERALPAVQRRVAQGRLAVHGLVAALEARAVEAPPEWAALLTNVNTPEDLSALSPPGRGTGEEP
jgi:molybdopterin-guanine dinucleotide biosynthesis protein A